MRTHQTYVNYSFYRQLLRYQLSTPQKRIRIKDKALFYIGFKNNKH